MLGFEFQPCNEFVLWSEVSVLVAISHFPYTLHKVSMFVFHFSQSCSYFAKKILILTYLCYRVVETAWVNTLKVLRTVPRQCPIRFSIVLDPSFPSAPSDKSSNMKLSSSHSYFSLSLLSSILRPVNTAAFSVLLLLLIPHLPNTKSILLEHLLESIICSIFSVALKYSHFES